MVSGKKSGSKGKTNPKVDGASSTSPKDKRKDKINEGQSPPRSRPESRRASDLLMLATVRAEVNKGKLRKLAISATEELITLICEHDVMWMLDNDSGDYVLNEAEYKKRFSPLDPTLEEILNMIKNEGPIEQLANFSNTTSSSTEAIPAKSLHTECTKAIGVVIGSPLELIGMFMNVDQWSYAFCDHVSRVKVLEVLSEGKDGTYAGAVQVMTAEFQFPSPLVETRETYFLRTCQRMDRRCWLVIDVSLESIFPNPTAKYIRRPSGCLLEKDEAVGFTRIKWIEHVEVDSSMVHNLFRPLVTSGFGFGAARWVATLSRQCDRTAAYMVNEVRGIEEGRKNILRLADRMMFTYISGTSASTASPYSDVDDDDNCMSWKPIPAPGAQDILVRTRLNTNDVGSPRGLIVTVATTIWLQALPNKVLDFLRNPVNRHKWDLLSLNRVTRQVAQVSTSLDSRCRVSVIAVTSLPHIFYLQETRAGSTGSYVVYAPIDMFALKSVLRGRDSADVQILSSGFVVMPDRPTMNGEEIGGTLLTMSFQLVDDAYATSSDYLPPKSVATIHRIVTETAALIKKAVV